MLKKPTYIYIYPSFFYIIKMGYVELTRLAVSRVMLSISIGYFLLQKLSTWITIYFKHVSLYEKETRLKDLCTDPNIHAVVDQCKDYTLGAVWPLFSSLGTTLKESFFCGETSCSQMLFSFLESWTGLVLVSTIIGTVGYTYITQFKKRKLKRMRMRRDEDGDENPTNNVLTHYQ
jgi:hypothetical protein